MMLTVEPPEYYPIIEKLFVRGIKDALDVFGIEINSITVGVKEAKGEIRVAFLVEVYEPKGFLQGELKSTIGSILEKLSMEATKTFGSFYNVRFVLAGFRVRVLKRRHSKRESRLVINCPDDMRSILNRIGKGLMIYLKEHRIDFSTLVLSIPHDGRPHLTVTVLLSKEMSPLHKEDLERELAEKVKGYTRTLGAGYLSSTVKVLNPADEKIGIVLERKSRIEKEAEEIAKDEAVREVMEILGKSLPGS